MSAAEERNALIARARKLRAEISQLFTDAEYWNQNVRKPGVEEINPDPEGEMKKIADGLDKFLADYPTVEEPMFPSYRFKHNKEDVIAVPTPTPQPCSVQAAAEQIADDVGSTRGISKHELVQRIVGLVGQKAE